MAKQTKTQDEIIEAQEWAEYYAEMDRDYWS
jgi:hypothetical protein